MTILKFRKLLSRSKNSATSDSPRLASLSTCQWFLHPNLRSLTSYAALVLTYGQRISTESQNQLPLCPVARIWSGGATCSLSLPRKDPAQYPIPDEGAWTTQAFGRCHHRNTRLLKLGLYFVDPPRTLTMSTLSPSEACKKRLCSLEAHGI